MIYIIHFTQYLMARSWSLSRESRCPSWLLTSNMMGMVFGYFAANSSACFSITEPETIRRHTMGNHHHHTFLDNTSKNKMPVCPFVLVHHESTSPMEQQCNVKNNNSTPHQLHGNSTLFQHICLPSQFSSRDSSRSSAAWWLISVSLVFVCFTQI